MHKKDLIQLVVTGILVIVLILALGNAAKKTRKPSQNSGNALFKLTVSSVMPADQVNNPINNLYNLLEQNSKATELRRDPFNASAIIPERGLHSDISLTGILWDKLKPLAIIDGNVVKKGQRVGNKTIMDIKRDRVILSDGQVLSEIKLEQ